MNAIASLLSVIDAFGSARDISDARASTLIFNDGSKVKQLREGKDIGVRTLDRSLQWLSNNWPDGAVWPSDVPRPAPTAEIPEAAE